jgi:hypothetical protein
MAFFTVDRETRAVLGHTIVSTVFALAAILCAAGLDMLEHFLAAHEASQWLLVGIHYLRYIPLLHGRPSDRFRGD